MQLHSREIGTTRDGSLAVVARATLRSGFGVDRECRQKDHIDQVLATARGELQAQQIDSVSHGKVEPRNRNDVGLGGER